MLDIDHLIAAIDQAAPEDVAALDQRITALAARLDRLRELRRLFAAGPAASSQQQGPEKPPRCVTAPPPPALVPKPDDPAESAEPRKRWMEGGAKRIADRKALAVLLLSESRDGVDGMTADTLSARMGVAKDAVYRLVCCEWFVRDPATNLYSLTAEGRAAAQRAEKEGDQ